MNINYLEIHENRTQEIFLSEKNAIIMTKCCVSLIGEHFSGNLPLACNHCRKFVMPATKNGAYASPTTCLVSRHTGLLE
ncbi:hypothetical protein CEXT_787151 [Caerostris extrusa]|uniref:Uncharacterized protein n=1 Tax=Caerostris extrusa TaxID=172846 RepID=A0AAV4XP58_CAEEX|nr:hypothetical protein CEXT_787151 [Caerostris extrusa]